MTCNQVSLWMLALLTLRSHRLLHRTLRAQRWLAKPDACRPIDVIGRNHYIQARLFQQIDRIREWMS
jgi:hypothetical protein